MTRHRRGWLWYLGFVLLALTTVLVGTVGARAPLPGQACAPLDRALERRARRGARRRVSPRPYRGVAGVLASLAVFSLWWVTITPTNDRDWQADVAELPSGSIDPADASRITIENVRNFDWITTTEFQPRWETRSYDLDALETADLVLTYWAGPAIAHTMVSFGFSDGEHLVFSVGIRPSEGEAYSSLAGFFKSYELIVTAADERDAIRLRTSVQESNRVHLYHVRMPPEHIRGLFLEYVDFANQLAEEPRFYRTIVANCTTIVWGLVRRLDPGLPLDYRLLLGIPARLAPRPGHPRHAFHAPRV